MESTYLPETAEPVAPATVQPDTDTDAAPALIFLESADGADVCAVDGECV
jgi:hypothetical protein